MRNDQGGWRRVSLANPCPVCGKPDWCLLNEDESAAICAREPSEKAVGNKGAGYFHQLQDSDYIGPRWRTPKRVSPERSTNNMRELAVANCKALWRTDVERLARELGLSVPSLLQLGTGWSERWRAFSFPMRYPSGNVSGIRYRPWIGKKFSEKGSKDGMFFRPENIESEYVVIVEGASDAAATMDLGFCSVVGRASCRGNVDQILTLIRRRQVQRVVIIPDNDDAGTTGAEALRVNLELATVNHELAGSVVQVLNLPDGINDVRQCIQSPENAEWLASELRKLCGWKPPSGEGVENE